MKKYTIHYNYYATADVEVLANSKKEAIEKADQVDIIDFDYDLNDKYVLDEEEVPDLATLKNKVGEILSKYQSEHDDDDEPYTVSCYPTITTEVWNGDSYAKREHVVESFFWDSDAEELILLFDEYAELELSDIPEIEQLNVCQCIIEAESINFPKSE